MNEIEASKNYFSQGYNCAQSVFAAFADALGVNAADALKISAGFGAGFGRDQNACGAVTGAIMAIGYRFHDDHDVSASKEVVYQKTRDFLELFRKTFGSIECIDLMGVNFQTNEGMKQAKEQGLFKTKCPVFIEGACRILTQHIL